MLRFLTLLIPVFMLAACATTTDDMRYNQRDSATAFTQTLAELYTNLSNVDEDIFYEWNDDNFFGGKAMQASNGIVVRPESPDDWNINNVYYVDLKQAYDALNIALYTDNAIYEEPVYAAQAQAYYDCWLEQRHERWIPVDGNKSCRDGFYEAMYNIYHGDIPEAQKERLVVKKDNVYRVFFAFDSDTVTNKGEQTVDDVVAKLDSTNVERVILAGHTDTRGSVEYNKALAARRAESVKQSLVAAGVDASKIRTLAYGEQRPLVETGDEVIEKDNRRVVIYLR
jgi:outer membrane protein OmpA-like peptidoglycan-associated protein